VTRNIRLWPAKIAGGDTYRIERPALLTVGSLNLSPNMLRSNSVSSARPLKTLALHEFETSELMERVDTRQPVGVDLPRHLIMEVGGPEIQLT
jgi:hypothetical protein